MRTRIICVRITALDFGKFLCLLRFKSGKHQRNLLAVLSGKTEKFRAFVRRQRKLRDITSGKSSCHAVQRKEFLWRQLFVLRQRSVQSACKGMLVSQMLAHHLANARFIPHILPYAAFDIVRKRFVRRKRRKLFAQTPHGPAKFCAVPRYSCQMLFCGISPLRKFRR